MTGLSRLGRYLKAPQTGTRDVFLVQKSDRAKLEWVEQNDFGSLPNYDNWRCFERRTIPADEPLPIEP